MYKMNFLLSKTIVIAYILSLFSISSCVGKDQHSATPQKHQPVAGPISYQEIRNIFHPQQLLKSAHNGGCSSVITSDVETGEPFVNGAFSLVTKASESLSLGLEVGLDIAMGFFDIFDPETSPTVCLQREINAINKQLKEQQKEINNIKTKLNLLNNDFYAAHYEDAIKISTLSHYTYSQALYEIAGNNAGMTGLFANFMEMSGFWVNNIPVSINFSNIINSSNILNSLNSLIINNKHVLQSSLINVAGINYNPYCQNDCYQQVSRNDESALLKTIVFLKDQLDKDVEFSLKGDSGKNTVKMFEQYNDTLTSLFYSSVLSIDLEFQMNYLINRINIEAVLNQSSQSCITDLRQIPSMFSNYSEIHYQYGGFDRATEIKKYNKAQEELTEFFSSIDNNLYITIMNYLVTDVPIQAQKWPSQPKHFIVNGFESIDYQTINYGEQVGLMTHTVYQGQIDGYPLSTIDVGYANGESVFSIPDINSNTVLYQYSGLRDMSKCDETLENAGNIDQNAMAKSVLNNDSCPMIFSNKQNAEWQVFNNGQFNRTILQPYYIPDNSESGVLSGQVYNVLNNCNNHSVGSSLPDISDTVHDEHHFSIPAFNLYWYNRNGGKVLMCGNWSIDGTTDPVYKSSTSSDYDKDSFGGWQGCGSTMYGGCKTLINFNVSPASNVKLMNNNFGVLPWSYQEVGSNILVSFDSERPGIEYSVSIFNNSVLFTYSAFQITRDDGYIDSEIIGTGSVGWDGNFEALIAPNINPHLSSVYFVDNGGVKNYLQDQKFVQFKKTGYFPDNFEYCQNGMLLKMMNNGSGWTFAYDGVCTTQ